MKTLLNTCIYHIIQKIACGDWIPQNNLIQQFPSELKEKIHALLCRLPKLEHHKYFNSRTFSFVYGGTPEFLDDRFWKHELITKNPFCFHGLKKIKLIYENNVLHLDSIIEKCPNLEKLTLTHHGTLQGEITRWVEYLPNLRTFKGIFREGADARILLSHCTNITALHIDAAAPEGFTNNDMHLILNGLPLVKLHLQAGSQITDEGFLHFSLHQTRLNDLVIQGRCQLSNAWISTLLEFSHLTSLSLQGCQINLKSQNYANTIYALKSLDLYKTTLTDVFIACLIRDNPLLISCKLLGNADSGIAPLQAALQCPHLLLLEFTENRATIQTKDVSKCLANRLKVLKIDVETNAGISTLISQLNNLKSLHLQAVKNVDMDLPDSIAKKSTLKSLVIDRFPFIPTTKFSIPSLKRFEITLSNAVNTSIFHDILQTCPSVSEIACQVNYLSYEDVIQQAHTEFHTQKPHIHFRLLSATAYGMLEKSVNTVSLEAFDLHHQIEKKIKKSLK